MSINAIQAGSFAVYRQSALDKVVRYGHSSFIWQPQTASCGQVCHGNDAGRSLRRQLPITTTNRCLCQAHLFFK
jgi:hypothetical protein